MTFLPRFGISVVLAAHTLGPPVWAPWGLPAADIAGLELNIDHECIVHDPDLHSLPSRLVLDIRPIGIQHHPFPILNNLHRRRQGLANLGDFNLDHRRPSKRLAQVDRANVDILGTVVDSDLIQRPNTPDPDPRTRSAPLPRAA